MKKLLSLAMFSLILNFANAQAQAKKTELKPIADETFLSDSGEKNFKIKCSNERITAMVLSKFGAVVLRYSVAYKKDRLGRYAEYCIYFAKDQESAVVAYLKSI